MEFGKIVVGLSRNKLEEIYNEEIDFDKGTKKYNLTYIERGYETSGIHFTNTSEYENKTITVFNDENKRNCIWGIVIALLYNDAINWDNEELQERIDKAKEVFKERTGKKGKVYIVGFQD